MKAFYLINLLVLCLASAMSFAGDEPQRASTRIDFNKMIDANNSSRKEITGKIAEKIDEQAAVEKLDAPVGALDGSEEQSDVVDFIDVELGWGVTPPVVDRRFDSVGAPRPYKLNDKDLENPDAGS